MLSLYEKIKIRLIILFLLAALSFIGLFFIINYQLVSERAVKRADSRFELIQKNVGYFFKDIERSALTLKDSLYLLKNTEEIQRAVILKMEMMPFLDSVGLVLDDNKYYLFSRRANDKITISARASLSIAPHSGVGGCAPRPRNERLAAEIIEVPMRMVKNTTIEETVPGRI